MNPWSMTLLLILLPPTEAPEPVQGTPAEMQVLKDMAYLLELWDRNEGSWGAFSTELDWCRNRQREAYGTPPLHLAERLPSAATINAYLTFNEKYLTYLEHKQVAYPYLDLDDALRETRTLREWWVAAGYARAPGSWLAARRVALGRLIELDPAAFWSARWPPHVPYWRFGR